MADSRAEKLARQARFVFQGRVKRTAAATMKEAAGPRTVIVTVDEVLQAPPALRHYAGKDVTVQLGAGQKVSAGQSAVFFTNPWLFGESVAVQALGIQPAVQKSREAVALRADRDPVAALADQDAQAHLDAADAVVSGRVVSVRVPKTAGPRSARAGHAAAGPPLRRPSEHDPMWREAVVEVEDVHKGAQKKKTIVVRFPASRDRVWSEAPKLRAGQEGYFVLHKCKGEPDAATYAVLHAGDFESFSRPRTLHALIRLARPTDLA